ncbi:hypothetical protein F7206_07910, partial [Helicobacter pylori]|nr:hypothetical protein [Helicobacter pylori]
LAFYLISLLTHCFVCLGVFLFFYSFILLFRRCCFFISFVFNFFSWGFKWFLCFGFLEPI